MPSLPCTPIADFSYGAYLCLMIKQSSHSNFLQGITAYHFSQKDDKRLCIVLNVFQNNIDCFFVIQSFLLFFHTKTQQLQQLQIT